MTDPTVFLTGFPGFLGSALVERLLARGDGPVACLVQPKYAAEARRRADAIDAGDRIRLYEGDVTEPDLGLGDAHDDLSSVRECYHLAAIYDLAVAPGPAERVNVRGTEHVLDAAEAWGVGRFHHVSTCYVSGRYDGVFTHEHLREGQSFNNHYERTKYEAEVAVDERAVPATVYRPAIVVGDSRTGETEKYDGPYYLLRSLLAQPRVAMLPLVPGARDAELNVVPQDYVVDAIATLSARSETVGETCQLCDPAPPSVPRFVALAAAATGRRAVTPTLPKPLAKRALSAAAALGHPANPATVDYLDHPTRYACPNARRALADADVEVPAFEAYVDRLVAFLRANPSIRREAMV